MNLVYLGFLDDPVGWTMEKIMDPIFNWLGSLLNTVFSWLFNTVLTPILESVLVPLAKVIINLIVELLAGALYSLMVNIWKFLDSMEQAFNIFIGISPVVDLGSPNRESMSLLEALFNISAIRNAFLYILVVALIMTLLFTIYSTARSIFDLEPENPRPVSRVLNNFFKACVQFMMVPLFVLFMIRLSGAIITTVNNSVTMGSETGSLGSTIFVISSLDAAKDPDLNLSTASAERRLELGGENDSLRYSYYVTKMTGSNTSGDLDDLRAYWNTKQVARDFKFGKFDFLVGLGLSIFLFIIMVSCSMVFIQRLFDMLVLYIASPFFVAMIPLDDGEKFKAWRDLFIGKAVTGFGSIVAMRMYLIIVPVIIGGQIQFGDLLGGSVEATYVLKMLFLLGGAWAVTKSGSMVTSLISASAGATEGKTASVGVGLGVAAVKMAGKAGWWAMSKGFGGKKKGLGGPGGAGREGGPQGGLQDGQKDGNDSGGSGNAGTGLAESAQSGGKIRGLSGTGSGAGGHGAAAASKQQPGGRSGAPAKPLDPKKAEQLEKRREANRRAEAAKKDIMPQKTKKVLGLTMRTGQDGRYHLQVGMGNLFTSRHNADGSHSMKLLGFHWKTGADGQMEKFSFAGIVGRSWENSGQGHMKFNLGVAKRSVARDGSSNLSIAGGLFSRSYGADNKLTNSRTFGVERTRNSVTGELYKSRNSWSGFRQVQDSSGNLHTTDHWGLHYEADGNGNYHFASGWGMKKQTMVNEKGEAESVGRSFLGMNLYQNTSRIEELSKLSVNQKKDRSRA